VPASPRAKRLVAERQPANVEAGMQTSGVITGTVQAETDSDEKEV
jgi:hypothetical protein